MNTELMAQVREVITTNPERHHQSTWVASAFDPTLHYGGYAEDLRPYASQPIPAEPADPDHPICGTTACVAGWVAILSAPKGSRITGSAVQLPSGGAVKIPDYAQEQLGLNQAQRQYLFSGWRTHEEVLAALDWLPSHPDASRADLIAVGGDSANEYALVVPQRYENQE